MNEKFTPGPWRADFQWKYGYVKIASRGGWVANVAMKRGGTVLSMNKVKANAHLIAAAPDLYAACEWALERLVEHHGDIGELSADLEAALRKARGEP